MWNKENSYKRKQEVFRDQCCLHLAKIFHILGAIMYILGANMDI